MVDTIYALSTGAGRSAVAVIRLSGPDSATALRRMTGHCPKPRSAQLVTIRNPDDGAIIDKGLALWFPGPHSFTGEDGAEFQIHGSRAVVPALLEALGRIPGCRLAEPGEFTRRAFRHGKLDLAAVEGLADLIDAQTEAQRKQAMRQLDGELGRWVDSLREGLLDAQALAESAIDFADEGDVGDTALREALRHAAGVAAAIGQELGKPRRGERIRDGFVVTLAGPPNAGKSTLLNTLARREAAIVSPYAGTTRDPIEVDLDLGGYAVVVIDTAGLRPTADPLEREGIARAEARAQAADLVLWIQEAAEPPALPPGHGFARVWTVGTKADCFVGPSAGHDFRVSAHSGAGMDDLIARIQGIVGEELVGGESALVSRARHRQALELAEDALRHAAHAMDAELVAENLRAAGHALGGITGRIDVEDVLGAIFARFCIGK